MSASPKTSFSVFFFFLLLCVCVRVCVRVPPLHIYTLHQVTIVENGRSYSIFTVSGNQGNVWRKVTVGIPARSSYQVKFIGQRGQTFSGDIALDDISFHPCQGRLFILSSLPIFNR